MIFRLVLKNIAFQGKKIFETLKSRVIRRELKISRPTLFQNYSFDEKKTFFYPNHRCLRRKKTLFFTEIMTSYEAAYSIYQITNAYEAKVMTPYEVMNAYEEKITHAYEVMSLYEGKKIFSGRRNHESIRRRFFNLKKKLAPPSLKIFLKKFDGKNFLLFECKLFFTSCNIFFTFWIQPPPAWKIHLEDSPGRFTWKTGSTSSTEKKFN